MQILLTREATLAICLLCWNWYRINAQRVRVSFKSAEDFPKDSNQINYKQ